RPDVCVAVLFVGNDFADELFFAYFAANHPIPDGPKEYIDRAKEAARHWTGPLGQGLNQAYRFKNFPGEAERSLQQAQGAFHEMQTLCDGATIPFLAVLLPTKMDVEADDRETWLAACAALGLTEEDAMGSLRLGQELEAVTSAAGIRWLDPVEAM